MSYKQILTTNDIGAGENQVAAGNHKQAYTSSECTTYTSDDNKIGITPAAVKKAFTIFEPKPHNHDSNYVKKTGDTMTGSLWINNNDGLYIQKNGQNWIGLTRDSSGSQYYGLWDCLANTWLLATDGSYTRLQENVYINKELIVGGDGGKGHIRLTNGSTSALLRIDGSNFWILGSDSATFGDNWKNYSGGHPLCLSLSDGTLTAARLFGAVWNDYAEFREGDTIEAGRCVVEVGDDTLITSTERMMPGANIISDTFGFAIGETDQAKTPIAVSGRVLAYPYESREEFKKNIGRPVCSGPNGTVSIMTDEEYRNKGYCAIGTISAVPDYEEWGTGKVKVNGRVWIKVF